MPDVPRFSVTVPAYNAASTLEETVASVRAQTFPDWELVIVNDGSTDRTLALAQELAAADPRIRVVSQENRGSGGAYNTAVREARSDLLVMLSADDLLLPEHLAAFDAFIAEHPEDSIFTCNGFYEYDDGTREAATLHHRWRDPSACALADLLHACFYGIGAVLRRDVYDEVGGFREDIYAEDYQFWLMAMARGFTHRFLDRELSVHRRNRRQKSADAVRMRQADVRALTDVVASGLLSAPEREIAVRVIRRHKLNIAARRTLAGLLGQRLSSEMVARAGALRHRCAARLRKDR